MKKFNIALTILLLIFISYISVTKAINNQQSVIKDGSLEEMMTTENEYIDKEILNDLSIELEEEEIIRLKKEINWSDYFNYKKWQFWVLFSTILIIIITILQLIIKLGLMKQILSEYEEEALIPQTKHQKTIKHNNHKVNKYNEDIDEKDEITYS